MKVVIVTNSREKDSLMPDVKFELIKETLAPIDVTMIFVEDAMGYRNLDHICAEDIVLVETKERATIHEIAIRGFRHTGECEIAVLCDADKTYLRNAGISMPKLFKVADVEYGKRYFVKPLILEDSIGIDEHSLCTGKVEVEERVKYLHQTFNQPAIIEEYIEGYDVTVGIIHNGDGLLMKAARIDSLLEGVPFQTEKVKTEDLRDFYDMANLNPDIDHAVKQMAADTFFNIGAKNYARLDFRVTEVGIPYLIEVNLYPGLKDTGAFYRTMAFAGIEYRDFLYMVLNTAKRKLM